MNPLPPKFIKVDISSLNDLEDSMQDIPTFILHPDKKISGAL